MVHRDVLGHAQLVNRSDGVVRGVWIGGVEAWDGHDVTPALGTRRLGRTLRARRAPEQPAARAAAG